MFVALGIHHGNRMGHIVICGLSDSEIFSHIISETACFFSGEKFIEQRIVFFFKFSLQLLSETFLTLRRIHRDTIINGAWGGVVVKALRH